MKKNILFVITILLTTSLAIGQEKSPLDNIRGGIGLYFLGSGDMLVGKLEFEYIMPINKRLNFGMSSNAGYGRYSTIGSLSSGQGTIFQTFTIHADPNIYLRIISLRNLHLYAGLGASVMFVNDIQQLFFEGEEFFNQQDPRFSLGGNIIFQLNYNINENTALALRTLTQPYINGDISTGISFNLIKTLNRENND